MSENQAPMLEVRGLTKHFDVSPPLLNRVLNGTGKISLKAVENVDFKIPKGKTFGLVGESGCGKSTVARLVVRLYEPTAGSVNLEGIDLGGLNSREAMEPRRRKLKMISLR